MATFRKRTSASGETRYQVQIRLSGKPALTKTFRLKSEAKAWAAEQETRLLQGTLPLQPRRKLAELIEEYLQEEISELSPWEQRQRRRQLGWWREKYGQMNLSDFTPQVVSEGRRRLVRGEGPTGRRLSNATANRYLAALSAACSIGAREWGWLSANPCSAVRRHRESRGRVRFLSEEERDRLLEAVAGSPSHRLEPLVLLALTTGARLGELLGLRWKDIDFERGVLVLHHTKNGDRRVAPLASKAMEGLRHLQRMRVLGNDRVFANARGNAHFPRRLWYRALEEAEIEDFRFHDLRHTAASYLAMSGATLTEIAEILGHKTLQMVKRYAHLTEDHKAAVVHRMAERFLS